MLIAGLLVASAPPAGAKAPAYRHYVGCGLSRNAEPSHACPKAAEKGAFFKTTGRAVTYSVCVRFPNGRQLCAKSQRADQGTLYVNKISSRIPGKHRVTWFVKGRRVGAFAFWVRP